MAQSQYFQSKPSVVACELDGGSVLLDLDTSRYFGLNAVGLVVWEQISAPKTIDQLCATVSDQFDVAPDVCRRDIEQLLTQFEDRKLVTLESRSAV